MTISSCLIISLYFGVKNGHPDTFQSHQTRRLIFLSQQDPLTSTSYQEYTHHSLLKPLSVL
ncbi:hypothetical protein NC651_017716 [Populus alba x Populus x berolinensis]|nr:hypothetical protein NC651_017716 [Populus alba x Populus x berolinensis]